MNSINKLRKDWTMEKRRILTTHSGLAAFARERIVVGRFTTLADAVRSHERRTAAVPDLRGTHDERLYDRLRKVGG